MICPQCRAWTRTLETRERPGSQTYRRYECANGHRFTTMETVTPTELTTTDRLRDFLARLPSKSASISDIALYLCEPMHAARARLKQMRDAYIVHWVVRHGKWVDVWALAESARDRPTNAPKPKEKR